MNLMKKIVLALMAAGMLVAVMLETAPAQTAYIGQPAVQEQAQPAA